MKIGDLYSATAQIASPATPKTDAQTAGVRGRNSTTAPEYASDRTELSSVASRLSSSTDIQNSDRAAKVAQLRSQFLAGRYEADSTLISRALVQSALDSGIAGR